MTAKSGLELAGWLTAVYLAAVAQIVWCADRGPHCLLAVAAYFLCRYPSSRGVLVVALLGLLMDALGNGRLGWHLGVCGVLAAVAVPALLQGRSPRWFRRTAMAAWLAWGDVFGTMTLSERTIPNFACFSEAILIAGWTAALVAGVELLKTIFNRCLFPQTGGVDVQLHNRWNRLTEA